MMCTKIFSILFTLLLVFIVLPWFILTRDNDNEARCTDRSGMTRICSSETRYTPRVSHEGHEDLSVSSDPFSQARVAARASDFQPSGSQALRSGQPRKASIPDRYSRAHNPYRGYPINQEYLPVLIIAGLAIVTLLILFSLFRCLRLRVWRRLCVYLRLKYILRNPLSQDAKSRLLYQYRIDPDLTPDTIRSRFVEMVMPDVKPVLDHTHGPPAADRSSASMFIDRMATLLGRTAYYIQRSHADEKNGRLGSRSYYWTKDLTTEPTTQNIPLNPLVVLVDVDQYIDMPKFLCENVHPTILYTVQPDQVSKVTNFYSYTFNEQNQLCYRVTGGAAYTHHVWNYSVDHLMISRTDVNGSLRVACYIVDRRATSPDHELVMLTPIGSWVGIGALLYDKWISGVKLTRLVVVTPEGFTRLMTSSRVGLMTSTGRVNNYASCTVTSIIDDCIAGISRTSDYVLSLAQVMSYVDGDRSLAIPLLEYHRSKTTFKPDVTCPVELSVRRYQYDPLVYDPTAKPSMTGFMQPMINGAFAPDRTPANELQSIDGRVTKSKPPVLPLTPFLAQVIKEWCLLIIPKSGVLDPVDDDEVLRRQAKPTQRRLFAAAHGMLPKRIVRMFNKSETYDNIKDPRAISMINTVDKRSYSRYMYAFETVLKSQPWYAFSKTPRDVAQRVVDILADAESASPSDFHRFDGHGSNVMRDLELQMLLRAFRPCYHQELLDLHKGQYGLKAYATFDNPYTGDPIHYNTDYTRLSGSPETSLFNSSVNSFTAYLGLRMTKVNGLFLTPSEAYHRLGIYGGDDGLTANVDPKTFKSAARMIGQDLVVTCIQRGEPGIKFLARCYSPEVWFGDSSTMCDIKRQLVKFHTCVRMNANVTPQMKLLEKVRSFSLSDSGTPIIGEFCAAVQRVYGRPILANKETIPMRTWLSQYDVKTQYGNRRASWMDELVASELPAFEYKRFVSWCDSLRTLDSALTPPMFMAPTTAKSVVSVVVDGDILPLGVTFSPALAKLLPGVVPPCRESKINTKRSKDHSIILTPEIHDIKEPTTDETFAQFKQRKVEAGTWQEIKPPPKTQVDGTVRRVTFSPGVDLIPFSHKRHSTSSNDADVDSTGGPLRPTAHKAFHVNRVNPKYMAPWRKTRN